MSGAALESTKLALAALGGAAVASPVAYAYAVVRRARRDHIGAKAGLKAAIAALIASIKKFALAVLVALIAIGAFGAYLGRSLT